MSGHHHYRLQAHSCRKLSATTADAATAQLLDQLAAEFDAKAEEAEREQTRQVHAAREVA